MDLNSPIGPRPTIISESKESEADTSLWKILILLVFGGGFSALMIHLFVVFLEKGDYFDFFAALGVAGLFLCVLILQTLFIKGKGKIWGILFLETIVPLAIFYLDIIKKPSISLVVGVLFSFLLIRSGVMHGFTNLEHTLKVRFFAIARVTTPRAVTGIALLFATVLFFNYFELNNFNSAIGNRLIGETLDGSASVIKIWYPRVFFDQPARLFFSSLIEDQLERNKESILKSTDSIDVAILLTQPSVERTKFIEQTAEQLRKNLEKYLGPIDQQKNLKDNLSRIIQGHVSSLSKDTFFLLGIGLAIVFLFSVKGILSLLIWIVWGTSFLLFKFLLATNFAHVGLQTRSREFIVLS